jgi:hypothetical protein
MVQCPLTLLLLSPDSSFAHPAASLKIASEIDREGRRLRIQKELPALPKTEPITKIHRDLIDFGKFSKIYFVPLRYPLRRKSIFAARHR